MRPLASARNRRTAFGATDTTATAINARCTVTPAVSIAAPRNAPASPDAVGGVEPERDGPTYAALDGGAPHVYRDVPCAVGEGEREQCQDNGHDAGLTVALCLANLEADLGDEVIDTPRSWLPPKSAFAGFRFPAGVIVVAVR
jgi:hypothetical protein